jgi:hypothetical protein
MLKPPAEMNRVTERKRQTSPAGDAVKRLFSAIKTILRAPGTHDDHVIALGLAAVNVSGAMYYTGRNRHRNGPADRKSWKKFGT